MSSRVTDYALDVLAGRAVAGPHVRNACERHMRDMQSDHLIFDEEVAEESIDYYPANFCLSGGVDEGRPFNLLPWQSFVIGSIYGWFITLSGGEEGRRFRRAYICTGKGSGKTPLIAGVGIRSIRDDDEPGAECYLLARNKEQTEVAMRAVTSMIEQSPNLSSSLRLYGGRLKDTVTHLASGSFMTRVTTQARGKGKSGPIPSCVICDEYHEHETDAMLEFYEAGTKKRQKPLTVIITNAGVSLASPCGREHVYATRVAEGKVTNDRLFSYVCELDEGDKPFEDESCWPKANPSLPHTPTYEYIREQVRKTKGMPSKRSIVERLNFCMWVEAESPWIDKDKWMECETDEVPPDEELRGVPSYLSIDLSMKTDLCSMGHVFDRASRGLFARVHNWMPEDGIRERAERDAVPYPEWAEAGYLEAIPGHVISMRWVAERISRILAEYPMIQGLAFDPHKIDLLEEALSDIGVYHSRDSGDTGALFLIGHPQGFMGSSSKFDKDTGKAEFKLWMPRSIDATEEAILQSRLKVERNPVLRTAAFGAVTIQDASENRRFHKDKVLVRIDPMVALAMGVGYADGAGEKVSRTLTIAGLYD